MKKFYERRYILAFSKEEIRMDDIGILSSSESIQTAPLQPYSRANSSSTQERGGS
jgi:hypothetical protein